MNEVCKYLSVVPAQKADGFEDGFVVEHCRTYDPALDLSIVCYQSNVSALQTWIRANCTRIADYVCTQIDTDKGTMGMQLIKSTLKLQSYTDEFVHEYGGVQGFLDVFHKQEQLNMGTSNGDSTVTGSSAVADDLPADNSESSDVSKAFDFLDDVQPDSVEETNAFSGNAVSSDESNNDMTDPEPAYEIAVQNTNEIQPVPEVVSEEVMVEIPGSITGVENLRIPFNGLVDIANYINKAAEALESNEFTESYILQRDEIPHALKYVDTFSPTMLKEFIMHYVESADTATDFIRVTKLLDELVRYSEQSKGV